MWSLCPLLSLLICFTVCIFSNAVNGQGQCPNGFTEESSLSGFDLNFAFTRGGEYLYLFFSVNFTCQAEVSSFILLARDIDRAAQGRDYPLIQIWRETSSGSGLYNRIHNIGGVIGEVSFLGDSLYRYTPVNGTFTVLPGDVLGLITPLDNNARISPYLLQSSSPQPQYYELPSSSPISEIFAINPNNFHDQFSPLIAVELVDSSLSSSPTTMAASTPHSMTPLVSTASTTTPSDSSNTGMPSLSSSHQTMLTTNTQLSPSFSSSSMIGNTLLTSPPSSSPLSMSSSSLSPSTPSPSSSFLVVSPTSTSLSSSSSSSFSSSSSTPSPSSTGSSVLTTAVVTGVAVAIVLVIIIIGLVFMLVLLFGLGRKRRRGKYSPSNGDTKDNFDNPNYTGFVSNAGAVSPSSTMTGDNFITHYEVPGYHDPGVGPSTLPKESLYDEAIVPRHTGTTERAKGEKVVYDEARPTGPKNGGLSSIYHELGPDDAGLHYEFGPTAPDAAPHYETSSGFIYEMEPVPSGYEQPVSSRSNTLKNRTNAIASAIPTPSSVAASLGVAIPLINHYDILEESNGCTDTANHYDVFDEAEGPKGTTHEYSVLSGKDIFVPTKEERVKVVSQSESELMESMYSLLEETQRQKYENIRFFEESDIYWRPAGQASDLYDQLAKRKYREIRQSQLKITKHLGSGQFGTVNEGVWHSPTSDVGVAIKMLPRDCIEEEKVKLLQEAAIMGQFSHPNVVKLHGVVTVGEPVMIIMELMRNGDLRNHLLSIRKDLGASLDSLPVQFLKFCQEIASGMDYLSRKSFVHRDLAARNVFLTEDCTCKIGDFGMSRDLEDENYYISHGGKVPVKWTAPEALLYKKYGPPTDVWSYGAVLYEIWSLGHKPFEGFSNQQYMEMIQTGYRLPPPPGCPRRVYQLMIHCWHPENNQRPTFKDILAILAEDPDSLLHWSEADKAVHPFSFVLGSELEEGQDLYPQLQQTFVKSKLKV